MIIITKYNNYKNRKIYILSSKSNCKAKLSNYKMMVKYWKRNFRKIRKISNIIKENIRNWVRKIRRCKIASNNISGNVSNYRIYIEMHIRIIIS